MDGILNIDKPSGRTSFSIVAEIRRLSGERRVGHAGTLDPAASGVLPVCLGKGTRVIEFLADASKTYLARIELGVTTDTYDGEGAVLQKKDASGITRAKVESGLGLFHGVIRQTPPMYSAIKHQGRPLYELARAGIEVERESREVNIFMLELIEWQPYELTLEVECSKGTYIRSLAHDLGQALGCGAYLKSLTRTRCGGFYLKDAVPLPQLEEAFRLGYWRHFVLPIDSILRDSGAIVVNEATEEIIRRGGIVALEGSFYLSDDSGQGYCRAYSADGRFLGILYKLPERGLWQPRKVFV